MKYCDINDLVCILVGYDESLGQTLTNECSVSQFIAASDPIRLLTDSTGISFRAEDDVYRDHPDTSDEIVTCLRDLKVCIAWRMYCVHLNCQRWLSMATEE